MCKSQKLLIFGYLWMPLVVLSRFHSLKLFKLVTSDSPYTIHRDKIYVVYLYTLFMFLCYSKLCVHLCTCAPVHLCSGPSSVSSGTGTAYTSTRRLLWCQSKLYKLIPFCYSCQFIIMVHLSVLKIENGHATDCLCSACYDRHCY